jgi:hypothetical protein
MKKHHAINSFANYDYEKFRSEFKEGVYTDGFKIVECCWDYDKRSINIGELGIGHTSIYPIVFHSFLHLYIFIGDI